MAQILAEKRIEWWGKQGVAKDKIKILNVPEDETVPLFKRNL